MADPRDTPAMRQYFRFKREHPGCILLFRIGDFYEMFDDDAVSVSKAIGLTLTQRTEGVPMAGVPYHQLEVYLKKLIDAGYRVAVAEQTQDAKDVKAGTGAVIDRAVSRVLTPGTLVDDNLLSDSAAPIAAVCFLDSGDGPACRVGVAIADLSTGAFTVLDCAADGLVDELARRTVTEVLYADTADGAPPARITRVLSALGVAGTARPAWHFRGGEAREALLEQFGVSTLSGFGLDDEDPALGPAGALIRYFRQTQVVQDEPDGAAPQAAGSRATLAHLRPPKREDALGSCMIDATSLRSLEVLRTLRADRAGGPAGSAPEDASLCGIFLSSKTGTPCRTGMGRRLLREWLCRPSADIALIQARHAAVATFVQDRRTCAAVCTALEGVQDAARIAARVALGRASPRDLVALGASLGRIGALIDAVSGAPAFAPQVGTLAAIKDDLSALGQKIASACVESPPSHLREGGLVRDGFDAALDEARGLERDAGTWLVEYQKRLVDTHGLAGIKVGYNKVFGYYIELTKAQARSAPAEFTRRQTLTGAERYITPDLKEFEDKVTGTRARALDREQNIFDSLCKAAAALTRQIGVFAETAAELDALACFADKAAKRRWVRPEMAAEPALRIEQGRHPVLDEVLGSNFVPNDAYLGGAAASLALITGPNMAGKSTFIRQTALIVLLAHAGSFVPADRAEIGVTDRIFTRIGADDALHAGQSTFMVEMTETARILHNATERSLIILDEIGRGTSTLDGLSLAWAIAETLAGPAAKSSTAAAGSGPHPRTLFATHYHELTDLEERLPGRVQNLHVSVREWGEQIVFLHRILPGRTDQSYGIHVAKLAGLPASTIRRAREVLESLAVQHVSPDAQMSPAASLRTDPRPASGQLGLFTEYLAHPALDALTAADIEAMTPERAHEELRRLKALVGGSAARAESPTNHNSSGATHRDQPGAPPSGAPAPTVRNRGRGPVART